MSSLVHVDGRGEFQEKTDRTLVSTAAFHGEFYTYVASMSNTGVAAGTFTIVSGASATTCPLGRVLHLTGRKLYPNVNPMTVFVGGSPLSTPKFLVSVYDPISFLKGFVDPTSNTFAKFDQNLPNFFNDGRGGSGVEWSGGGQGVDIHMVDSGNLSGATTTTQAAGNASTGRIALTGGAGSITVTSSAVTANSRILLTNAAVNTSVTSYYVSAQAAGTFTITVVGGAGTFNFLIIN